MASILSILALSWSATFWISGLLAFSLVPLAVFNGNPGMTVSGWMQLGVIFLVVGSMVARFARKQTRGRLVCVALSYPGVTITTNVFGIALIPNFIH